LDGWVQGEPSLDDETLLVIASPPEPVPAPGPDVTKDPAAILAEARRRGHGLVLRAHLDALAPLGEWVASCPGLERLGARDVTLLESGLYELCANIAEHGYGPDDRQSLEVWWLPDRATSGNCPSGVFVLVDQGRRFSPGESGVDFRQPAVRRRGRGIGLEIVRATMRQVSYHPATAAGNVTLVVFDPSKLRTEEEAPNG
jgi:anti-sigma regulatory factor (Ser/Thr protein kinase)